MVVGVAVVIVVAVVDHCVHCAYGGRRSRHRGDYGNRRRCVVHQFNLQLIIEVFQKFHGS